MIIRLLQSLVPTSGVRECVLQTATEASYHDTHWLDMLCLTTYGFKPIVT